MSYPVFEPPSGTTLYIPFTTYDKDDGGSITMTGFAVTDIEIYKNGSTTQRSSDNGVTLLDTDGTDFDGVTGLHGFSIDLSDNTDAGFYAVGSWYWVVVSTVTVDAVTITFIATVFRIKPAETVAGFPKADVSHWLGTAASTPTVAGVPNVNAKTWNDLTTVALPLIPTSAGRTLDVSAGGEAGVDWANVGSPATAVDLSGTNIKTNQKVDVETIKTNPVVNGGTITFPSNATVASTTGAVGSVTGAVGSVTGAVGSVTGAVGSVTGAVGSVTGNVGGSVAVVTALAVGAIVSGANAAAELNAIADALLDRNMATGSDNGTNSTAVRTVRQALRRLRNKESIAAGTGTVTKEDDATLSWTYAATTTAGDPISAVDPT